MLAPYFFVRERLKGTEIQFGDLYPIFSRVVAQDSPGQPIEVVGV